MKQILIGTRLLLFSLYLALFFKLISLYSEGNLITMNSCMWSAHTLLSHHTRRSKQQERIKQTCIYHSPAFNFFLSKLTVRVHLCTCLPLLVHLFNNMLVLQLANPTGASRFTTTNTSSLLLPRACWSPRSITCRLDSR